jgi:hypothetical protein
VKQSSIARLMLVVALCAVSFAALRFPNALSLAGMRLLTFGTVGYSILGIIYRHGVKRAGWVGFAIFAGGCLLIQMYAGMSGEDPLYEIGRCMLALACGVIGWLIAIRLYNTREAADRAEEQALQRDHGSAGNERTHRNRLCR